MSLLFEAVIITSYYATIVGIIVILFKKLFEKGLDANWHYLIWFVLILKLLLPNGPQSTISIFNILPWQNLTQEADYLQSELVTNPNQPIEPVYFDNEEQVTEKNAFSVSHQDMLPYIWAAGTVVLLLWLFFTSFALQRKLRRSANQVDERVQNILSTCKMKLGIDKNIPVLIQDIVSTPSIFGYFRPAILLTKAEIALNDQQIKYILLHELAHYQRKDTFVNYLLLLLQAVHWFNPVMWYCFKQIRSDMEIATDERVLNILDENEHKDYSRVLVAILERFSTVKLAPKLLGMVNDEHEMKHRLRMVNKAQFFRKHRNRVITVGVICLVILSVFLLTNARLKQEVPFKDPELEAVARKIINMPKEVIYESDLNIKTFWGTNGQAINDLSGIEYAKNLESVRLAGNKIVDITPLAALTQLHELDLSGNQIIDISPLSSLVALKRIWFDNNQINDISVLSSFTDLLQLHLSSNKISDITALKDYDRIVRLYLDHNDIVNISALADIDCKIISLKYNRIHDISPLVANEKISAHVQIYLEGNPLNKESIEKHIPMLRERGVNVIWSDIQSINEASQLTDYPVATLTFLPPGFNADQTFNIGLTSGSPEVNQYWEGPGGLYLSLTQSLTLDGVIGDRPAEKIEINGKEGEIIYIGDNPPSISIYWRESKMSYVLNAQLEGPLSKEMIVKLAKSVQ